MDDSHVGKIVLVASTVACFFQARSSFVRACLAISLAKFCFICHGRRNYPNFLNLFGQALYIPLCFAYLVPASRWGSRRRGHSSPLISSSLWPRQKLLQRFAIMGALDCLATTLQTFAAVYLPGPLLILLPQAAIPVSLALTAIDKRSQGGGVNLQQWVGAATVLLGCWIVLEPVLRKNGAPDYYCEALDRENDCTLCQTAFTEEDCLTLVPRQRTSSQYIPNVNSNAATTIRWLLEDKEAEVDPSSSSEQLACQWLPFEKSAQEKEFLELFWSLALIASTVPMALSALYKQRAMLSVSASSSSLHLETTATTGTTESSDSSTQSPPPPPPPALYVSGWIAVFQFVCSVAVAVPAGLVSSPLVRPWEVPQNLIHGMFCYAGVGVVETGCHPDTACSSSALWVNVTVICHVVYTLSMMLVLKYSDSGSSLLFLALTAIVPIGHLFFTLPFMPERTPLRTSDLAGLIVILSGLVLYRFSSLSVLSSDQLLTATPEGGETRKRSREAEERQAREHRRSQSISIADLFAARDDVDEDEDADERQQQSSSMCLGSLWPVHQTSYTLLRRDTAVVTRSEDV